jgi:hypothetical protein
MSIASLNGIPIAQIALINGIPIGDIGEVNGISTSTGIPASPRTLTAYKVSLFDNLNDAPSAAFGSHTPDIDVVGNGWQLPTGDLGDDYIFSPADGSRLARDKINHAGNLMPLIDAGEADVFISVDCRVEQDGDTLVIPVRDIGAGPDPDWSVQLHRTASSDNLSIHEGAVARAVNGERITEEGTVFVSVSGSTISAEFDPGDIKVSYGAITNTSVTTHGVGVSDRSGSVSRTAINRYVISHLQARDATAISLVWLDAANNEDSYSVDRNIDGAGWVTIEDKTLPASADAYVDEGPLAAGSYVYRVYCSNASGDSGFSNESDPIELGAVGPTVYIHDTFVGNNGDPIEGRTPDTVDQGAPWYDNTGFSNATIQNNQYQGSASNADYVDTPSADMVITLDCIALQDGTNRRMVIVARSTETGSSGSWELRAKMAGGSGLGTLELVEAGTIRDSVTDAAFAGVLPGTGTFTLNGSNIAGQWDSAQGTLNVSYVGTRNQTTANAGIGANGVSDFDNFKVTSV